MLAEGCCGRVHVGLGRCSCGCWEVGTFGVLASSREGGWSLGAVARYWTMPGLVGAQGRSWRCVLASSLASHGRLWLWCWFHNTSKLISRVHTVNKKPALEKGSLGLCDAKVKLGLDKGKVQWATAHKHYNATLSILHPNKGTNCHSVLKPKAHFRCCVHVHVSRDIVILGPSGEVGNPSNKTNRTCGSYSHRDQSDFALWAFVPVPVIMATYFVIPLRWVLLLSGSACAFLDNTRKSSPPTPPLHLRHRLSQR